jgi:DNA-binding XRE family transcriptional regulator
MSKVAKVQPVGLGAVRKQDVLTTQEVAAALGVGKMTIVNFAILKFY